MFIFVQDIEYLMDCCSTKYPQLPLGVLERFAACLWQTQLAGSRGWLKSL